MVMTVVVAEIHAHTHITGSTFFSYQVQNLTGRLFSASNSNKLIKYSTKAIHSFMSSTMQPVDAFSIYDSMVSRNWHAYSRQLGMVKLCWSEPQNYAIGRSLQLVI